MQYRIVSSSEIPLEGLSFWQLPTWKNILLASHQAREVFYYRDNQGTFLLIEIRSIGLGFFGAFSLGVNAVQIGSDWGNFLEHLQDLLRSKGALFLQIEPTEDMKIGGSSKKIYKKFLTPHTRILNLSLSLDKILEEMHEKGRYNIRLAEKRGVVVSGVLSTPENLDIWMRLLDDTLSRDHFSGNSREYYKNFVQELEKNALGGLYFAYLKEKVIAAGIFVFTSNQAIYYYGASSSDKEARKQMAPYLLQWHVITEAKSRGLGIYDFLGVSDPDKSNDSLRGVTDFKDKFGGMRICLPKKKIYPLSYKYSVFLTLKRLKNLINYK